MFKRILPIGFLILAPFIYIFANAQTSKEDSVLVEELANPNDYNLFANNGWDGNWYVGYNTCWIKKLPAIPPGEYSRAYIGVKLGRAKAAVGTRPGDAQPISGEIFAALSSTTAWSPKNSVLIARTQDIPLEGDPENAFDNVGESQWFWKAVPLEEIHLSSDNYVAVWSPSPALFSVSSSPVLAAGWGDKQINSWLLHDVQGAPPRTVVNPDRGISYFQPAIALKLIPASVSPKPLEVKITAWTPGTPAHLKPILSATVTGTSVERVWVEALGTQPKVSWQAVGHAQWKAPFIFSIDMTQLPIGHVQLRVVAVDISETQAVSQSVNVVVSPLPIKGTH